MPFLIRKKTNTESPKNQSTQSKLTNIFKFIFKNVLQIEDKTVLWEIINQNHQSKIKS